MTRIQPECFIECYANSKDLSFGYEKPESILYLFEELEYTKDSQNYYTTALFLIKPTPIPLAERLEARRLQTFKP